MIISGTGITTFNAKIKPDFVPATVLALNWVQLSNGDYACTDRGAAADQYDTEIRLYKDETTINNFINQIEANRVAGSNVLTLSGFNSQEHIFGADVNYSGSIAATAIMTRRAQKTWRGWELPFTLKCLSPTFVGGNGSLPPLRFIDVGVDADSDYTINKFDSYNRVFSYQDHVSDIGAFTGTFTFTDDEMILLRRFIATNRGTHFATPVIIGIAHPFGRRANPTSVKIMAFEDLGMFGLTLGLPRWKARITFVEASPVADDPPIGYDDSGPEFIVEPNEGDD